MTMERVVDFLDHLRDLHSRLGQCFDNLERVDPDPRLRLLLVYLRWREQELARCIGVFEGEAEKSTLRTWLPFVPEKSLAGLIEECPDPPTFDKVRDFALELDEHLEQLLHHLAEVSPTANIREMFADLATSAQHKKRDLLGTVQQFEEQHGARSARPVG
jgi:hypothetical protein